MEFESPDIQRCAVWFQTVGFDEARQELESIVKERLGRRERVEATALLLRIRVERDDPAEMETLGAEAAALIPEAVALRALAALFHLGITSLLCDDVEAAGDCFATCREHAKTASERAHALYGIAAVLHNQRKSEEALGLLMGLESSDVSPDFYCLSSLLKGNCLRGLHRYADALAAYTDAQRLLPHVKTFYLKNWVLFGLGNVHARLGDTRAARTHLQIALSITHPQQFRRLHKLLQDELERLESHVEVLFDPVTGDIVGDCGYLSLRRKPTLIAILTCLMRRWPATVSKQDIYTDVWRGEYHPLRHDGLIYSHMQRLRQILTAGGRLKDFVLTTQDGYRLSPDVRVRLKETAPGPTRTQKENPHVQCA